MPARIALIVALGLLLGSGSAIAQQPSPPIPLLPGPGPRSIEPEPLPPIAPAPETPRSTPAAPPAAPPSAAMPPAAAPPGPEPSRIFCEQSVGYRLADPARVPERYRSFVGIWSDASWTPQLCAALIVENVTPDGTATIVYVFGPMGASRSPGMRASGGVLHGTGIIRDGELKFQNTDGSQFAFHPLYADLDGRLTTPQGQSYGAVFKNTP